MAIRKVFSVYDEKAEAYLQPFFMDTIGLAIRAIQHVLNDPQHDMCKYSSDYTLFLIGEFDDSDATLTINKKPLGNLLELKAETDNHKPEIKMVKEA